MVATTYTYDPAGHPATIDDGAPAEHVSLGFDAAGRHASQTIGSGSATTYAYLATGNSVSSTSAAGVLTAYSAIDAIGDRLSGGIPSGSFGYLVCPTSTATSPPRSAPAPPRSSSTPSATTHTARPAPAGPRAAARSPSPGAFRGGSWSPPRVPPTCMTSGPAVGPDVRINPVNQTNPYWTPRTSLSPDWYDLTTRAGFPAHVGLYTDRLRFGLGRGLYRD